MPAFVQAFVAGKWVSLDLNALKGLVAQFAPQASTSPQQSQKLLNDLRSTLTADVTVTRVGTDDQGDHLKLTTDSKQLLGDLLKAIQTDVPSASLALSKLDASKIPAHSIVLDAWVNDGALSKLRLDIAQFAPPKDLKPGDSLPIVLTFDRSGDSIDKPSGATPVDLTQIGALLGGLGSGG
jgi:hypothetical protein